MVIMESYFSQEQIRELWLKIDQLHLSYLELEESPEKIIHRTKLEDCIAEFLCVVPHKHKFALPETEEVLYRSAAYKKGFSGYRAATGWNALQMYAGNLLTQPWRKEYRQIKTYCGFYKHQIEANLIGAEKIFEIMGYKHIGNGILALDGPVCPDRVANISRDCLVAYVECQILKHMWEEVSTVFNISWLEILEYRRNYAGSPDQCVKNLKYKFNSKHAQEPIRNPTLESYENKYHPTSSASQISMPISHNYIPIPSHNHAALPVPAVPYYMPHTNGCPNAFATYGYASCNAHNMPVVKQPLPAVVAPNGYYYTNGFPMVSAGYPVPTGQLIEIESRNGYDMVDGTATTSRVRKLRTNSNATYDNDKNNRNDELPKNGLAIRADDKQDSEEDWDYVYKNLERQGYSKDLGERGDVLGLSVSDKQRRHSKESKKVKATNLDEVINNLTVNDRPLKMTEALERMEQKSAEKIVQPKERRHSQGSSYENVVSNEAAVIVKPLGKPAPSIGTQTKSAAKEKTEKDISKSSINVEVTKMKDKEKGHHRSKRNKPIVGKQAKEVVETLDESNPVIQMFKTFSLELDDKHDRYERVVKLSRDITIESKRIIFLLHSINTDIDLKKNSVLEEAYMRLTNLCNNHFKTVATELRGHDGYLYHRAFTSGMQEFIEALCFYQFIKNDNLDNWLIVNQYFQYKDEEENPFTLLFSQYDFILGIADFTGELMRKCINTLGVGNISDCFKTCNFVRTINTGFLGLSYSGNREISRKAYVLRQSLAKMELVCYNIQIRGSEIPKHMLMSVIESQEVDSDMDEGFCL